MEGLKLLKELVEINSETSNIKGVNTVQDKLKVEFTSLGYNVSLIQNPDQTVKSGALLLATKEGRSSRWITFVCHADTVFRTDEFNHQLVFNDDKTRAIAPGIVDNKGGIVILLNALREIKEDTEFGVRVICSPNEETGSPGFHELFNKLGKESEIVLGLEPALPNGDIITSRKGNRWYDISIEGKRAHSGREHHKGINACVELALKISKIQKLTDYGKDITVNVGKISGGEKHNVVSDHAMGQLDVRFPCFDSRSDLHQEIEEILSESEVLSAHDKEETDISYAVVDDCPPFKQGPKSKKTFEFYKKCIEKIEKRSISSVSVGGAADSNHLNRRSSIVLDGLGAVGGGMHTYEEFIELSSLKTRAQALRNLIESAHQLTTN